MPDVTFDPGNLRGFADHLDGLISQLDRAHRDIRFLGPDGGQTPEVPRADGSASAAASMFLGTAEQFLAAHEQVAGAAEASTRALGRQLEVLAAAARDIADTYREAEDVAEAIGRHTERLLDSGPGVVA